MRRSPRVLLAWTAAAIVVVVTIRVVAGDLGALHRRAHSLGPDVPVVLAAHDLALGATLRPGDVRVVHRPANFAGDGAAHDPAAVVGRVVAVPLLHDEVVAARHLASGTSDAIPAGRRAVHVVVKDGFQPPVGAVVDVLAAYDPAIAAASAPGRATVVARGARVLALAGASAHDDAGSFGGSAVDTTGAGVTVLVTEDEARAVAYAAAIGEVMLALAPAQSACCGGASS